VPLKATAKAAASATLADFGLPVSIVIKYLGTMVYYKLLKVAAQLHMALMLAEGRVYGSNEPGV
jgi:hypothetical protein